MSDAILDEYLNKIKEQVTLQSSYDDIKQLIKNDSPITGPYIDDKANIVYLRKKYTKAKEIMFELPTIKNLHKVVVGQEVINKN